ncbi:MAG: restriction endonuclease subunit S [Lachnospiraceae bacterium]|nr:restriction endonuclease subunit S [Lachnospiraceae bacterium]
MEYTKLKNINEYISESVSPMKTPEQIFEMYSVPIYDTGHPEYLHGSEIASNKVKVKKQDILLCKINPRINRVWVVTDESEYPCIASSEWIVIRNSKYNPEFLAWYFRSPKFKQLMTSEVTGIGGSLTRAQPRVVAEYPVPVLKRQEQDVITNILNRVNEIIDTKKQELQKLDELVKARFVEMFGDPNLNPKKWDVVNISEVVDGKVSNGFFAKRDDYCDDGNIRVLGVANIVNRMYSNLEDLPRTNADDKDIEKFEVKYGDMLFCRSSLVAEGIGKASIIPEDVQENILFECHVIRLPLDLSKCVPEFMQTLSTMDYFRNQVISQSKTATMTTIGQDGILKTDIILPPIDKQKEFYDFVKQVDKSKLAIEKSLEEMQLLFDSLMQKYFG